MMTLKAVDTRINKDIPYAEHSYMMMQARVYYLTHEVTPAVDGSKVTGPWRVRVEIERENGESVMLYVGDAEMYGKVYVMNDAGKTIDVIV